MRQALNNVQARHMPSRAQLQRVFVVPLRTRCVWNPSFTGLNVTGRAVPLGSCVDARNCGEHTAKMESGA